MNRKKSGNCAHQWIPTLELYACEATLLSPALLSLLALTSSPCCIYREAKSKLRQKEFARTGFGPGPIFSWQVTFSGARTATQQHFSIELGLSIIPVIPELPQYSRPAQMRSVISAILVNFREHTRLEVSGSMEDNFTSMKNDGAITDGHKSTEEDCSSTKNNCTRLEDGFLDAAEQELDEESIPIQKEGGWISP